jgi:hypothetical protein
LSKKKAGLTEETSTTASTAVHASPKMPAKELFHVLANYAVIARNAKTFVPTTAKKLATD